MSSIARRREKIINDLVNKVLPKGGYCMDRETYLSEELIRHVKRIKHLAKELSFDDWHFDISFGDLAMEVEIASKIISGLSTIDGWTLELKKFKLDDDV